MKRVINYLPTNILVGCKSGGMYYLSNGIVYNKDPLNHDNLIIGKNDIYYVERIDETLKLFRINVEIFDEKIIFSGQLMEEYFFNEQYRELDIIKSNIAEVFHLEAEDVSEKRASILEKVINRSDFLIYTTNLLLGENWYQDLLEHNLAILQEINIFMIYFYKVNKAIPLLLQNDMQKEIECLFTKKIEYDRFGYNINAKTIKIAKLLQGVYASSIIKAHKLLTKYNLHEIEQIAIIAKYFGFSTDVFWDDLIDIDVNLTEFANYFIKSILSTSNIDLCKSSLYGDYPFAKKMLNFFTTYKDYFLMKEPEDDLYPENLEDAHDIAMNFQEKREKENQRKRILEVFVKRIKGYQNLSCKIENYEFVIPEKPEDLEEEGRKMHHCVGGYVSNVCNGRSKIVFVKKDGESYITIECRDDKIVQAKKFKNELPNIEDEKILKKWADMKLLEISSY